MRLKIASWNVNSLRVRLPQVLQWLAETSTDVLALQETKTTDDDFPRDAFHGMGYEVVYTGQKAYNGVCIVSRAPFEDAVRNLPGSDDPQRRLVAATYEGTRVINVYVPNGETVDSNKYRYKLDWLQRLAEFVEVELRNHPRLVMVGDFNVAPEDVDVYDPESWRGQVLFSDPERNAFRGLLALGLRDTFRLFTQDPAQFTWWDYRMAAFRRNRGLRIDHILARLNRQVRDELCRIDPRPRRWERPSDHAPVIAEFDPLG